MKGKVAFSSHNDAAGITEVTRSLRLISHNLPSELVCFLERDDEGERGSNEVLGVQFVTIIHHVIAPAFYTFICFTQSFTR
ncbi:hypothetical protein J6590_080663 [Homalodisca vitripennis]|nr:hypothetical protein J6590_080663 [Homalodisca vitripennis]